MYSDDDNCQDDYQDEEYCYSDDDGSEPESTTLIKQDSVGVHFVIPDASYELVDYKTIAPMRDALISDLSSLLYITLDEAQALLQAFKWNKERIIEQYYDDSTRTLTSAGLMVERSVTGTAQVCRICLDDMAAEDSKALQCGHAFCRSCYSGYLASLVSDGPSCVLGKCPELKCECPVLRSVYTELAAPEVLQKYLKFLTRNFIDTSSNMRWCPSAGCELVAVGSGVTTVKCACSQPFCFRCGREAHDPATCSMVATWDEKCSNESETANWILANTKTCPKCNVRIEKNQGCNHMTCKSCKHDFCWICSGAWATHGQETGGYYKCNRYEVAAESDPSTCARARAKAELDRYLHYYKRYHGHEQAVKFATSQRESAVLKMQRLQEEGSSSYIDVEYFRHAVEQVIESRRILKYTYVLGHCLKDGTMEKQLFEHHQEMLEKNVDMLSELTEMKENKGEKAQTINLTRITAKFLQSLISTMGDVVHKCVEESSASEEKEEDASKTVTVETKKGKKKKK